jgi:hypothetical protein
LSRISRAVTVGIRASAFKAVFVYRISIGR